MKRLFFFLLLGGSALGQGVMVQPKTVLSVVNGIMRPVANATITVCAANASGIPCSPFLSNALFKDTGLTQPLSNPFATDANGNYQFAIAAGTYTVTETAAGFAGYSYQLTATCSLGPCTVTSLTVTGGASLTTLSVSGSTTLAGLTATGGVTAANIVTTNATAASSFAGPVAITNGVYNATSCSASPAPSWCAGGDVGAWVNAAYAALPSSGGEIDILNTSNSCLAYTTPIVLNTSGKYVQLVGHGGRGTTGGACLNFTPTSGIAITLDYVPTSVVTYPPQHGIRDITFINNNCTTSGGCGGSAFGINFGSTNWGASNAVFDHVAIIGFAFGYNNGNTNNIPSPTWIAPVFQANGIAFTNGANTNNIFLGGFFVANGGGIQATAVPGGEYTFDQTNFAVNTGPLFDFTRNTTRTFVTCVACHFEDSPSASASSPHFVTGLTDFRIYGGVMETDQTSGTQDWFVSIAAGGVLEIHGLELLSGGKSLTQAFLLNTTARGLASLTNISPVQIPTIYGGAGATQSFLNVMTTNAVSSQTINTQTISTSLILANLLMSTTAPTITGHFNTSGDSISNNNGTAAFTVTVGTGAAGSMGTVGLPTAAHGWNCAAQNQNRGAYIQQTSNTTASATFTNYGTTVGTPVNWTNSDVLSINCNAL